MGRKFRQKPVPDTKQAGTERLECIGIAGSGPSVGVTHFSLMTAAYLSGVLCRRTAVLEQNESGSFAQLGKIFRTGKRREKPVIDGDFGALTQKNQDAFFRCSRCFLVGSVSGWQLADFAALAAEKQKWKKWCEYFVSFGEEEAVKMAEQYLDIRIRRIPLQKNALMVTGESMTFFGKFLR